MIRPPPRSTPFPTRRSSDLHGASCPSRGTRPRRRSTAWAWHCRRSEEHTSELQSRFDLVCRLLLEKKKNIDIIPGLRGNTALVFLYTIDNVSLRDVSRMSAT